MKKGQLVGVNMGSMYLGATIFNLITNQKGEITHVHVFFCGWPYQDIIPLDRIRVHASA